MYYGFAENYAKNERIFITAVIISIYTYNNSMNNPLLESLVISIYTNN